MKTLTKVLAIAGSDSGAGAGIQADIKTISALGCYATTAITALTAQNTLGVEGIFKVNGNFVKNQIQTVLNDIRTDAIKIGMLFNEDIIFQVYEVLKECKDISIVLDPVCISTSGHTLLEKNAIQSLKELLIPLCTLITPNIYEAQMLSKIEVKTLKDLKLSAQIISEIGAKNVFVKGGHLDSELAIDVLYKQEEKSFKIYESPKISTKNTHGTGCTLSSAIASHLALGYSLHEAIQLSKKYLQKALELGAKYKTGEGHGPLFHFAKDF